LKNPDQKIAACGSSYIVRVERDSPVKGAAGCDLLIQHAVLRGVEVENTECRVRGGHVCRFKLRAVENTTTLTAENKPFYSVNQACASQS
jgi:hypothetical protein